MPSICAWLNRSWLNCFKCVIACTRISHFTHHFEWSKIKLEIFLEHKRRSGWFGEQSIAEIKALFKHSLFMWGNHRPGAEDEKFKPFFYIVHRFLFIEDEFFLKIEERVKRRPQSVGENQFPSHLYWFERNSFPRAKQKIKIHNYENNDYELYLNYVYLCVGITRCMCN